MEESDNIIFKEKKKILGIPMLAFIILSIVIVSAAVTYVAYHHEFTKNIHVVIGNDDGGSGSGQDSDLSYYIVGSGDISDSSITCGSDNEPCIIKSQDISLVNTGNIDRTCTITYESDKPEITAESSIGSSTTITAGGSVIFYTTYTASESGDYSVKTIIDCPSS